jgi:antitoxin component YwqK of YwqJK toxin-antitoxin module
MKKVIIILVLGVFISCNEQKTVSNDGGMIPMLPVAAQLEPYDDGSGLVRVTTYATEGNVLEQGDYLNNMREGIYTEFHPNGYIKSTVGYVHGKKQGQLISMDNRGQLLERSTFHNDILHGSYVKYDRSRIKEKKEYVNGNVSGQVEKFYANGKIMERSNYTDGMLNGVAKWYDQQGNLTIEYTYNMGELVQDNVEAPE